MTTIAAQAAAAANVTSSQNIGHDGEEIETKHQPGQIIPQQQQGHGPHGPLTQQPHPLQAHQQVRIITFINRFKEMKRKIHYVDIF